MGRKVYWTYERCQEELLKYSNIDDIKNQHFYKVIIKNNWKDLLDTIRKNHPNEYWTYERCKEEALKYENKTKFSKESGTAYKIINKNKWHELANHMIKESLTQDQCKKEILKYKNINEIKNNHSLYYILCKNKWMYLLDCLRKISNNVDWSYEKCKEKISECVTIKELSIKYPSCTKNIYKNGWLELLDPIRQVSSKREWTYEKCREIVSKYETISDLRKECNKAYYHIRANGWLDLLDCMRILPNYYKRLVYVYKFSDNYCYVGLTCDVERRKYQHQTDKNSMVFRHIRDTNLLPELSIETDLLYIKEAVKKEEEILQKFIKNGWKILNKHKTGSVGGIELYWTKERCIEEVCKYNTHYELRNSKNGAYNSMYKNGWLYEILNEYMPNYVKRKCK